MTKSAASERQRGRPREYDEEQVIERAMQVFWTEGYHATSLPGLLAATKLSRGSLYAAFGDKHGIFLRALDRYIDQALARTDRELSATPDALANIQLCIDGYLARTEGEAGKRGCLVVATAMEMAAHDKEVAARIGRFFKLMEARLSMALTRARQEGTIASDVDPQAFAHMLICLLEGIRVIRKVASGNTGAAIKTMIARLAR